MSERQYASPVIVRDGKAVPLHRLAFDDDFHDEEWVQELLFAHPELLPFEELEPAFKGSIAIAREVESGAGPLDILFVNDDGFFTVVETKLWRNPQSRREVVSQLIHYAAELAKKSYEELCEAVSDAYESESSGDPLLGRLKACGHKVEQQHFHDAVSQNLRRGRFLLLAVGDGIQEGVEAMAEFLHGQPHLGFTMALVEMALFRFDPMKNDPLLVQPRIVARTREVKRAIIEMKGDGRMEVSTPPEEATHGRPIMTEDEFFRKLAVNVSPAEVAFARRVLLEEAPKHRLTVDWKKQGGPLLKYFDHGHDVFFTVGGFSCYGELTNHFYLWSRLDQLELPERLWTEYSDTLIRLIPGASRYHGRAKKLGDYEDVTFNDDAEPLRSLIEKQSEWFSAIDKLLKGIDQAMAKR